MKEIEQPKTTSTDINITELQVFLHRVIDNERKIDANELQDYRVGHAEAGYVKELLEILAPHLSNKSELKKEAVVENKFILDACCGTRAMWYNKQHPNAVYMDIRRETQTEPQGHQPTIIVDPDILADFREIPFEDKHFKLVVCDPPHLTKLGESGIYRKLYGKLDQNNWREDLKKGFSEMWRVLDDYGILLIKWNDYEIGMTELKKLFPTEPLFYNRKSGSANSKTMWFCFMKMPDLSSNEKEVSSSKEENDK